MKSVDLVIIGAGHSSIQLLRKIGNEKQKFQYLNVTLINEYPFSIYSG